jgi:hypothetical protein
MPSPRRFPPPWTAELQPNYYVVRDADGQQIAYVYYSNDPDRRSAGKLLTKDEARRIAANIAKLPDLLGRREVADRLLLVPNGHRSNGRPADKASRSAGRSS